MINDYLHWLPLNFTLGSYRFTHWLSWIGSIFIIVFTPIFYILRRRYPQKNAELVRAHVFSNLFSFMLISIHFTSQMIRAIHPEDRTGLTLYIIMILLVATGFLHRFQILGNGRLYPPHRNRYLHISITTAFYIVIIIHIVHTLGIL